MPTELNDQQLETLQTNGYLSIPTFISQSEAARIRNTILRLFEKRAGAEEGAYGELISRKEGNAIPNSPQIRCPVDFAPELHDTDCFRNALRLAKQILGPEARFFSEVAILKSPRNGAATPWHQDEAFRDPHFAYQEITVWVALQDVDEESGCLTFLPGSHGTNVLEHHAAGGDIDSLALECTKGLDLNAAVPCPIPAGGCTVHFPRTLHCSTPNRSKRDRIGYALTFGITPKGEKTSDSRQ